MQICVCLCRGGECFVAGYSGWCLFATYFGVFFWLSMESDLLDFTGFCCVWLFDLLCYLKFTTCVFVFGYEWLYSLCFCKFQVFSML